MINRNNKMVSDINNYLDYIKEEDKYSWMKDEVYDNYRSSVIIFKSNRKRKEFRHWCNENKRDSYLQKVIEYIVDFAKCAQYISALHGVNVRDIEHAISTIMIEEHEYSEEVHALALNLLKQVWKYGDNLR